MATQSNYAWRRDKDGLGVWEHRGKVAVAGYGHSPVDRRWDGVSMDKTLGAYSHPRLPEGDGRRRRHGGPDRRRHLLRQPHRRPQRRFGVEVGAAALLRPALRLRMGPHAGERGMARQDDGAQERQVRAHRSVPTIGEMVGMASQAVGDGMCTTCLVIYPCGNLEGRYRRGGENADDYAKRRAPVDGAVGQSRRERLHQHLPPQPVLPQIRRPPRRSRARS